MGDPQKGYEGIDSKRLTRLLSLGFLDKERPVDELLERLAQDDGSSWFQTLLADSPAAAVGPPEIFLADGRASLEQVRSINRESKKLLNSAESKEDRLTALVCYFLSVAAASVHHGTSITSRTREELDPILLDLSSALPLPWSTLLSRAIRKD